MRYICIDRRRKQYPVTMMCRVLKVSRSGYYAWRVRPECQGAKTDRQLSGVIRRLHEESKGVYGSPRITADLRDEGYRYGRHKVARLMRLAGLRGCPKRRFRVTTIRDPSHPVAENLLDQDFTAAATESTLGIGYYVYRDQPGLALPGGGNGSLFQAYCGLVDESLDQSAPGDGCAHHGDWFT